MTHRNGFKKHLAAALAALQFLSPLSAFALDLAAPITAPAPASGFAPVPLQQNVPRGMLGPQTRASFGPTRQAWPSLRYKVVDLSEGLPIHDAPESGSFYGNLAGVQSAAIADASKGSGPGAVDPQPLAMLWGAVQSLLDDKDQDRIIRRVFHGDVGGKKLVFLSDVPQTTPRAAVLLTRFSLQELHRIAGDHRRNAGRRRAAAMVISRYGGPAAEFALKSNLRHTLGRATNQLARGPFKLEPSLAQYVVDHQDEVERLLKNRTERYVQMSALPVPWRRAKNPWTALSSQLPPQSRYDFMLQLLKQTFNKAGTDSAQAAALTAEQIAALEPTEEVRRAVADFIVRSRLVSSKEARFQPEQVSRMFDTRERFQAFFPWTFPARWVQDNMLANLLIAVRTAPASRGVDAEWLTNRLGSGDASILGFRPVTTYAKLANETGRDFAPQDKEDPITAEAQIRGLIVQGGYERNGHSVLTRLVDRGGGQVEQDAVKLLAQMTRSLQSGALAKQKPLNRRLFAYGWTVKADDSLIEKVRQLALDAAEAVPSFYTLRCEVHNFPTLDLLERIRQFRASKEGRIRPEKLRTIDRLISQMERFLMVQGGSASGLGAILNKLEAGEAQRAALRRSAEGFASRGAEDRLDQLIWLRTQWQQISSDSRRRSRTVDRYLGDRKFSELAMALGARLVETLKAPKSQADLDRLVGLSRVVLGHIVFDNLLDQRRAFAIADELAAIAADPVLAVPEKTDLLLKLLGNAVDHVHHGLDQDFGKTDQLYYRVVPRKNGTPPVKFVDSLLRSSNVLVLSRLVDRLHGQILQAKGIHHTVGGQDFTAPVEVYNPGVATGILRLGKDPMELTRDEIGVFEQFPAETAALGGIVTLGLGARLSHLQLLAKALGIPNVKVPPSMLPELKKLHGKRVTLSAGKDGRLVLEEAATARTAAAGAAAQPVEIPEPDLTAVRPVTFAEAGEMEYARIAGPKGIQLSRMFNDPGLHPRLRDGFMLPFGFFKRYAESTGLSVWLGLLAELDVDQDHLVSLVCRRIRDHIAQHPLPDDLKEDAVAALRGLKRRTGHKGGYFFRSDTNMEDLRHFNGAGLNESIPNVQDKPAAIDQAVRGVWSSAFQEKSVFWRAAALSARQVPVALPSVVVMPTVSARASGVVISRGGAAWERGKGVISADRGISSVVHGSTPVEEIDLASRSPYRYGFTVSTTKHVADPSGGLTRQAVPPGTAVLSPGQVAEINSLAQRVDTLLGEEAHGWDIEWAVDEDGRIVILQARPNM